MKKRLLLTSEEINVVLGYNGMKHEYQRRRNFAIAAAQLKKAMEVMMIETEDSDTYTGVAIVNIEFYPLTSLGLKGG